MKHYLMVDDHNPGKGHHIMINEEGQIWYNQATHEPTDPRRKHLPADNAIPGIPDWWDFYDEPEQVWLSGSHGYQEYIVLAWNRHSSWIPTVHRSKGPP